ncbi:hypothetical protein HGRIS_007087 [Hohenbuehelia grisea]|uniref:RRM domain-containing protein n=1 Tax=Hohenbuehelia grisea TaxID=104357 RepID=A0ABR3JBC4_9AGAR
MFATAVFSQARLSFARSTCRAFSTRLVSARVPASSLPARNLPRFFSTTLTARGYNDNRFGEERKLSAVTNTLYIGNLPYNITEMDIRDQFLQFGTIESVRIGMGPDGRSRGYAHVQFVEQADAEAAVNSVTDENPLWIQDRICKIDYAAQRSRDMGTNRPNTRLYVAGFGGDEFDVKELFSEYRDQLRDVFFLRSKEDKSLLGPMFLEFDSIDTATQVIEDFNSKSTPYGVLNISYAAERKQREGGPQRGGRGGGGRGGQRRDRY